MLKMFTAIAIMQMHTQEDAGKTKKKCNKIAETKDYQLLGI